MKGKKDFITNLKGDFGKMAYKWSWAFGPETALELETYTPWDPSSTSTNDMAPSNTIKHTYVGDAGDRYSMGIRGNTFLLSPQTMLGHGWFSAYFYYNGSTDWGGYDLLRINGPVSGQNIALHINGPKSFNLQMRGYDVTSSTDPLDLSDNTWHHVAVKYDMRNEDDWGAEVFVNGVSVMSGTRNDHYLDAETTAFFSLGGAVNSNVPTDSIYWSDIVIYDDLTDPNPFGQFVTRVEPYFDVSESGSWTPASNPASTPGDQASDLSGTIGTSPVVSEADPLTGEFVRLGSQDLGTNLGLTSFNSFGFTSHLFASGSSATNILSNFKFDSPNPPYISGTAAVDGENAYAWASSGSTSLASGTLPYLQAEISGS
tara:strand:+ start:7811 stop:8926 length:1116 start_codon:yes stop_codon:yes gene_type:complete